MPWFRQTWAVTKYWAVVNSASFIPPFLSPSLPPSFISSSLPLSFFLSPSFFLSLLYYMWVNRSETTFSVSCVCMLSCSSCVWLCAILRTVACQTLLSMEFFRQEHWSGLPFPPPGDLPDPGIEPTSLVSPALQVGSLPLEPPGKPSVFLRTEQMSKYTNKSENHFFTTKDRIYIVERWKPVILKWN